MVSPQQQTSADCNVQLMEKSNCEGTYVTNKIILRPNLKDTNLKSSGPKPECTFDREDAKLICNLEKEVRCRENKPCLIGACNKNIYSTWPNPLGSGEKPLLLMM